MENKFDGNAVGGTLQKIFSSDMTLVQAICEGCGATNVIGELAVYMHPMGVIIRCPLCDSVLIRVAQMKKENPLCIDMQGVRIQYMNAEI